VEETALALNVPVHNSVLQMADLSSVVAGSGGDSSGTSPIPSIDASTVNESALLAITPPDDAYLDWLSSQRSQVTTYEVQEGDLLSFIASDYGVSADSIVWANGLRSPDSIYPGQVLKIPPVSGVIHAVNAGDTVTSIAKKYGIEAEKIIAYNKLPQDGTLQQGDELIIPGGKIVSAPTGAVAAARTTAQFSHLPDLKDYFLLPTYGYNWGRIHGRNGVDIANSCGTPIVAAADGTVTVAAEAGYNGGFGKYIKISHPNGTETLYAHASKLLVAVGQVVGKGQKIALMGTTGRSTGCHLHFEVHGARNPLAK
jgi:murein DD-endopeptidase MepM/ murein hydrolase activator NlpD